MTDSAKTPLADWIDRQGLKQVQAAEKLGVSEPYLSQILSGKRAVSLRRAAAWAKITGLETEDFLLPEAAE